MSAFEVKSGLRQSIQQEADLKALNADKDMMLEWGQRKRHRNGRLETKWPKFFMALSRKEKEDDFLAIKGSKLSQRPKRRSKQSKKVLNYVTPGMWLSDLTRERYEVREKKAVKKRRRGLKTMGSVDTDSE